MGGYNYRLTSKLKGIRWTEFPKPIPDNEFSFVDCDECTRDWSDKYGKREYRIMLGRPRYTISFKRIPKNRKKPVSIYLCFNDDGYFERHWASGKITVGEECRWISEGFDRLCELRVLDKAAF